MAAQESINDIWVCKDESCSGQCSNSVGLCRYMIIAANAPAGAKADVVYTNDGGSTWTNTAAQPFAVSENVVSAICFQKDKTTTRWIVARGAEVAPANPAEIAYSDDGGVTWTNVDVEASGIRFAVFGGALFALDPSHIWFGTSGGYIFFSSDGGLTWENQEDGNVTTEDIFAIKFANQYDGFAVCGAGNIIRTVDGGKTWALVTDPSGVDMIGLHVFDKNNVIVGDGAGEIFRSWDGGTTWTQLYTSTSGVADIDFVNEFVGFVVFAANGLILRTRNGGEDWETISGAPVTNVYNAVVACNENFAYAVGEIANGDGTVVKIGS